MLISFSELEVYNQSFDVCAGSSNTISSYAMWHIYCEKLPSIKIYICSSYATFILIWRKKNCSFFWQVAGATAGKYFCGKWQCSMMELGQTSLTCSCLPPSDQQSNPCLHQTNVQQLQATFLEDPAELSLETSLAWLRENWQNWLDSSKTSDTLAPASSASPNSALSVATVHSTLHPNRHCSSSDTYRWRTGPLIKQSPLKLKSQQKGKISWDRGEGG